MRNEKTKIIYICFIIRVIDKRDIIIIVLSNHFFRFVSPTEIVIILHLRSTQVELSNTYLKIF